MKFRYSIPSLARREILTYKRLSYLGTPELGQTCMTHFYARINETTAHGRHPVSAIRSTLNYKRNMEHIDKTALNELIQYERESEDNYKFTGGSFGNSLISLLGLPSGTSEKVVKRFIASHIEPLLDITIQEAIDRDDEEALDEAISELNLVLVQLQQLQPRDQIEMMLTLQVVALNKALMKTIGLISSGSPEAKSFGRDINLAKKLGTTINDTIQVFNKQRSQPPQGMEVKNSLENKFLMMLEEGDQMEDSQK